MNKCFKSFPNPKVWAANIISEDAKLGVKLAYNTSHAGFAIIHKLMTISSHGSKQKW